MRGKCFIRIGVRGPLQHNKLQQHKHDHLNSWWPTCQLCSRTMRGLCADQARTILLTNVSPMLANNPMVLTNIALLPNCVRTVRKLLRNVHNDSHNLQRLQIPWFDQMLRNCEYQIAMYEFAQHTQNTSKQLKTVKTNMWKCVFHAKLQPQPVPTKMCRSKQYLQS